MDHDAASPARKHRIGTPALLIIAWILIVLGTGWTIGGATWALIRWSFVAKAVNSSGVVIGNVSQGRLGCPQVRFRTAAGNDQVSVDQGSCANPPRYQVNAAVPVIYDPADPNQAAIPSFDGLWMGAVVMGTMGIISLVIGLESYAVRRHRLLSEPGEHSSPRPPSVLLFPRLLMIAGLIMVGVTVPWTIDKRSFVAAAASAPGVVVGQSYHPATGRYGVSEYCPKVQFRTQSGDDRVFEDTTGCNKPPAFAVNTAVTVLYDAAHPEYATIQSFRTLWSAQIGLASTGALFFILGLLWYRSARKRTIGRRL